MAEPNTTQVDIVSAEGELFSGRAVVVFAAASQGDLGIYPRHAPLLTLLKPGEVRVQTPDGEEHHFFVGGGALEVQPNKVTVLADTALRAKDIDEAAALAAKQRAEDALRDRSGLITLAEAQAELARAIAQLKVIQRLRNLRG
jgi:F-type H+-transporting ATPase subunit epsilon